jgi:hypothetical protein
VEQREDAAEIEDGAEVLEVVGGISFNRNLHLNYF